MFRGVHSLSLDDKGRMVMPTKYRQKLQADCDGQLVATVDRDQCILLYPLPEWERVETALFELSSLDPRHRRLQRLMSGYASELDMSANGRLSLPQSLREVGNLQKRIVLVGQGHKFEIWDEETWNQQCQQWFGEESEGGEISEALQQLRL